MSLINTITLQTVLDAIGVSSEEFIAAWVDEEVQLKDRQILSKRDNSAHNRLLPRWMQRINDLGNITSEDKGTYRSILNNWRDEIVSNITPRALPEQGTKFVTGLVDKTRKFFDDIVLGTDDVSKIGFYDIPEADNPKGLPVIVPSSINIQEHLLNQPIPTVRSKSVAVLPNHRSKHTVSIDLVFPNYEAFSSTEQDYPSFINIYHMFKFMPINSIYSSALCTAFINEFTFPRLFETVGEMYAADVISGDTYEEKLTSLFKHLDINDLSSIIGLFQGDEPDLDIGLRSIFDSLGSTAKGETGKGWKLSEFDSDGQDDGPAKFPVPVCFKSASIQTLESMPGAILGRFSFGIISSPAFPYGAITYRDINGNRTLNPSECYWGKRYISLASKKLFTRSENDIRTLKEDVDNKRANHASLPEITNNDIRLYYIDIHSGVIYFDTTSKLYARPDGQAPVVLEKVSAVFNSKTVDIPLMGSPFPTVQYMGMNSSSVQVILAITNKKIISDFMGLKAQILDSEKSQYMLNSFGFIENPLINSLGISRVTPQSVTIESDPDSPGLYRLIINFVENIQDLDTSGRLQLEKGGVLQTGLDEIWDYFYDLYKIWAISNKIVDLPDGLIASKNGIGAHSTKLDMLMGVLGLDESTDHMPSILNPDFDTHGIPYGTLLMGIIAHNMQERTGSDSIRPTGRLGYDFPELSQMRIGIWRDDMWGALINIAFGSIRGDREGALGGSEWLGGLGYYFEIDKDADARNDPLESRQGTIFSKSLHKILFDVEYDDPFVNRNEDWKDSYHNNTLENRWWGNALSHHFGAGLNTEENAYYSLREDLHKNKYLNSTDIDVLDWEYPFDWDDTLYGLEHTFTAKSLLDIWHTQRKVLPKALWDNILKVIINRENTDVGGAVDQLVAFSSTDQSFGIFYNLISEHQDLYTFHTEKDESTGIEWRSLSAYGVEAKLNITKLQKEQKQIDEFEDIRVDMYPDLELPTYEGLFSSDILISLSHGGGFTKDISPLPVRISDQFDPSVVRTNLMEVFAPKCGDKGVVPSGIPYLILATMTLSDLSDIVSAHIHDFIEPDIFYWRNRDKQLIAESIAVYDPKLDQDKMTGGTFYFPLTLPKFYENAIKRMNTGLNDNAPNKILSQLEREKKLKDYATEVGTAIESVMRSAEAQGLKGNDFKALIKQELKKTNISLEGREEGLEHLYTLFQDMLKTDGSGRKNIIEFVTSDEYLVVTMLKDEEGKIYAQHRGTNSEPMIYNPVADMSFAMLDTKNLARVNEQQMVHQPDLIESVIRSFPTVRLYFIEEDRKQVHYKDDFYGFSDIMECSISSNIYDADVCTMKLANFGGILSSQSFIDRRYSKIRVNAKDASKSIQNTKPEDTELIRYIDDAGGQFLDKVMLRPGVHIMVKMGYGNNVEHLRTVFTGEIAEVKSGSVVEIIAQGFQTELQYDFGGFMQEDWMENFRHWIPGWMSDHPYKFGFLRILNFILLGDLESAQKLDRKGTPHLGEKFTVQPYRKGGPFGSKSDNWGYGAGGDVNRIRELFGENTVSEQRASDEGHDRLSKGAGKLLKIFSSSWLESNYFGFQGYDLSRNIYTGLSNGDESLNQANEYLVTTGPVMDSIREVVRYMPNFIATVVPYEQDATLFIGDPAGPYEWRKPTDEERKYSTILDPHRKDQESLYNLNSKYNLLANAINIKSAEIKSSIKSYNLVKAKELLLGGLAEYGSGSFGGWTMDSSLDQVTLDGMNLGTAVPWGLHVGQTLNLSEELREFHRHENVDLSELCRNVLYNPASGIRLGSIIDKPIALSDTVHANLLAMYLGISRENVKEHATMLTNISKELGDIFFNSDEQLHDVTHVNDLYSIGSWSGAFLREPGSIIDWSPGINRLYPLIVSSMDEYRAVKKSTKSISTGNVVTLDEVWIQNATGVRNVASAVQKIFSKYNIGDKLDINTQERDQDPVKLIPFMDTIDKRVGKSGSSFAPSWFAASRSLQDIDNNVIAHDFEDLVTNIFNLPGVVSSTWGWMNDEEGEGAAKRKKEIEASKVKNLKEVVASAYLFNTRINRQEQMLALVFEYKQFLMLADTVLNDEEVTDIDGQVRELIELDDSNRTTMPFHYKLFRDTHVISSTHDLIANNLVVSRSDMWTAINLRVPKDAVSDTAGTGEWGPFAYGIDEPGISGYSRGSTVFRIQPGQDFGSYPSHGSTGINYRGISPGPRDIIEPFTEINATTATLALRVMQNRIAQGLSKMYRGNLIMIGRNIKPYDQIVISDDINNMYGTIMVEKVIQNFSAANGWTTTIVPSALTIENSSISTYNSGYWMRMLHAVAHGRTFSTLMDVVTVVSFLIPVLGGVVKTGQVALNTAMSTLMSPLVFFAGLRGAQGGTWVAMKGVAKVFTHGGKWGIGSASVRLPGIWTAMRMAPNRAAFRSAMVPGSPTFNPAMTELADFTAANLGPAIIGSNLARGLAVSSSFGVGRTMLGGTLDTLDQFFNPQARGGALFTKGNDPSFQGATYLPAKVALLRYNGAPLAALSDMYDDIESNGWDGLYTAAGYSWRELWASPVPDANEAIGVIPARKKQ